MEFIFDSKHKRMRERRSKASLIMYERGGDAGRQYVGRSLAMSMTFAMPVSKNKKKYEGQPCI